MDTQKGHQSLFFDPDGPEFTKQFELMLMFELIQCTVPGCAKGFIGYSNTAMENRKCYHTTDGTEPRLTIAQYDEICDNWRSKDRVAKFLGMFSSSRMYTDWQIAHPDESIKNNSTWDNFLETMKEYYKPTGNPTLKNFHFRELTQGLDETSPAFCNRTAKEAKHCYVKCHHSDCNAEETTIRDQIIIGTRSNTIIGRRSLLKSWNLATLHQEEMKIESATRGGAEISREAVNNVGKYAYSKLEKKNTAVHNNVKLREDDENRKR